VTPVPATYHRNSYSELRGNLSYARQKKRFLLLVGQMVYSVRRRCGQQLAIEAPVEADLVSTVPESATPAALGYAQKVDVNLPFFFISPSILVLLIMGYYGTGRYRIALVKLYILSTMSTPIESSALIFSVVLPLY